MIQEPIITCQKSVGLRWSELLIFILTPSSKLSISCQQKDAKHILTHVQYAKHLGKKTLCPEEWGTMDAKGLVRGLQQIGVEVPEWILTLTLLIEWKRPVI